ncbi:MAG: hypothetical protein NC217_04325 [Muribaculaceae bacterium]|nr:hypothetical protein [Muribaculaceae bacterium]
MKTHIRLINKLNNKLVALFVAIMIMFGAAACGPTRSYWGVDQSYPVGNGHVYYGAYGGDGPHYSKKQYKHYKKQQKKMRKEREKYLKKQRKQYKKRHHHDD